jgi:glycerol uptake facilitator-like aquaporin
MSPAAGPERYSLAQRLAAEMMGSALLVLAAITPMILGHQVLGGGLALAVLMDAVAVAFVLFVLIEVLEPVSYCHINPAVTLAMVARGRMGPKMGLAYVGAQFAGGLGGALLSHAMFCHHGFYKVLSISHVVRGHGAYLGEFLGTFILVMTIFGCMARMSRQPGLVIGLLVGGLLLATSSTMFANPQVTLARIFTFSVAGVRPLDGLWFIVCECLGALAAAGMAAWLFQPAVQKELRGGFDSSKPTAPIKDKM